MSATFGSEDGLSRLMELRQRKTTLEEKNKSILEENLKLTQEITSLHDKKNLEHKAREVLGYVYPDEVVFVLRPN